MDNKKKLSEGESRPLILVVNDDGIQSPGIAAAARAAGRFGQVLITAPVTQQTSMGRAYPRYPDLGIIEELPFVLGDETIMAYGVHSSPAHATAYGILEIADRTPDLVVSGINLGANLGRSITCSGTLGACFEAASHGIPCLAMSLETPAELIMRKDLGEDDLDFQAAEEVTAFWINHILAQGIPQKGEILNVNVPYGTIAPEEYRLTCLDNQNYYELRRPPQRDWSRPYTMDFEIRFSEEGLAQNGDIRTLCMDRIISATPLGWDLTKND